jgi:hypothetical protein
MDTRIILLSSTLFERWAARAAFRRFVFGVFAERLVDLMTPIDATPSSAWTSAWPITCSDTDKFLELLTGRWRTNCAPFGKS